MVGRKYIPLGSGHERVGVSKVFDPRIEVRGLTQENTWKKFEECSKPSKSPEQFETLFRNVLSPAPVSPEGGYVVKGKEESVKSGFLGEKHPSPAGHSHLLLGSEWCQQKVTRKSVLGTQRALCVNSSLRGSPKVPVKGREQKLQSHSPLFPLPQVTSPNPASLSSSLPLVSISPSNARAFSGHGVSKTQSYQ